MPAAVLAGCATPAEMLYLLTAERRAELRLDLRFLLRDAKRARSLRLLVVLLHTIEREPQRIRFPAEVLEKLVHEIDSVAATLPEACALFDLREEVRAFADGMVQDGRRAAGKALPAIARSACEEAQFLRHAAAAMEVSVVSPAELAEPELAAYMSFCMSREDYSTVIAALRPRLAQAQRVWMWDMTLEAMRLSGHADLKPVAHAFEMWISAAHPEVIATTEPSVDQRRLSRQAIRALGQRELACP